MKQKAYAFGHFRFDAQQRMLFMDGRSVPLPPKALGLLALLIEHRGRVAEKQTLMQELWPGTFVEEGNLAQHVWTLRKVLGEDAIETVPRRGYRLTAEIKEVSTRRLYQKVDWRRGAYRHSAGRGRGFLSQNRAHAARQRQAEAYQLYLKGRTCLWDKRTPDGVKRAAGYFEQAKRIDPNCALAWAGLSDVYSTGIWSGMRLPYREARQKARGAAERALQLDPNLPEGHASLAEIKFRYEWDWPGAEHEFRAALALNPRDPLLQETYGVFLAVLGRVDEATAQFQRAQQLEPLSPFVWLVTGWSLNLLKQHDQAIKVYNKALELDPGYDQAHQYKQEPYMAKGMYAEAVAEAVKGAGTPETAALYRKAYETEGIRGYWRAWGQVNASNSITQARLAARMGKADECMRWLEKAYAERHPEMPVIARYWDLDPMRQDPRFVALMNRLRLPASPAGVQQMTRTE